MLPALGVGVLSCLGSAAVSKAMGSGLYLKRDDCVCTVNPSGTGLYLKPSAVPIVQGDGRYQKRGQQFYDESGFIQGPNSHLKNILGMLL